MMDVDKLVKNHKSVSQPVQQSPIQPELSLYTVGQRIPDGFYSAKVRMSADSSQSVPVGESRGKQVSSV